MDKFNKDLIIIGGGPAGLTAALYSSRSEIKTLVIEKAMPGGQLWLSEKIENYPGFPSGIKSFELAEKMKEQALDFGAELINEEVSGVSAHSGGYRVECSSSESFKAPSVIITTGAKMKKLGVPGEAELSGKGVSYCAVCDGPFFKDKKVVVVGGGNTACEEALYLCRFASKVILIHRRDRLRAVKGVARKLEKNPKIEIIYEEEVAEIKGSSKVEGLKLKSGRDLTAEGVFIFIGYAGSARWIRSFVENKEGFIKTDSLFRTSREGVFAAGDCRSGAFRQVVCACGEGAQAAEEARKYVEKKKGISYDW